MKIITGLFKKKSQPRADVFLRQKNGKAIGNEREKIKLMSVFFLCAPTQSSLREKQVSAKELKGTDGQQQQQLNDGHVRLFRSACRNWAWLANVPRRLRALPADICANPARHPQKAKSNVAKYSPNELTFGPSVRSGQTRASLLRSGFWWIDPAGSRLTRFFLETPFPTSPLQRLRRLFKCSSLTAICDRYGPDGDER